MASRRKYAIAKPTQHFVRLLEEGQALYARGADVVSCAEIKEDAEMMQRALDIGGFSGQYKEAWGIAHQQVKHDHRRFFVVRVDMSKNMGKHRIFMNPRYLPAPGAKTYANKESCLTHGSRSYRLVERFDTIKAFFLDETLQIQELILGGIPAAVFQHETDHCDGKTVWSHLLTTRA